MMVDWVKKQAARLVYGERLAVVPSTLRANWPQRAFLKRFLSELEIDCVLDVGANGGQYGSELRRIGYRGLVISFEPDPTAFQRLRERAADDRKWEALNVALGREAGRAKFNIMEVSLFNSFRAPSTSETDRFAGANEIKETVEVDVERLSDALPRLRSEHSFRNVFLKMDTQGFDSEVFAGASGVHGNWPECKARSGLSGFTRASVLGRTRSGRIRTQASPWRGSTR
ncbi:FkbM family methyltransferase [Sphingomonas rhizophila]|uniref:FkbM family methyltransferase n=1 Tax=Sphingomonas rhizophila TaxID=2071607 RepID=A0A7G9SD48_9SPHN|nr:FkbM family methyltransferase [Sphingomonas rhizophila]QNN65773.1 FkbM family methyltransferase [Sphingomonas rhizophila]